MESTISTDTFQSQLGLFIWVRREEIKDLDALRRLLDMNWPELREHYLARAAEWIRTTSEIEIYLPNPDFKK